MQIFIFISQILFILSLGFYLITCLQWFSYKFERVIFHFTKPLWHLMFLALPIALYFGFKLINFEFFYFYFYLIYLPILFFWHKKLDKKLVFTARIKRFFIILLLVSLFLNLLFIFFKAEILPLFLPLALGFLLSFAFERYQNLLFYKAAKTKLNKMPNLIIIQITASYGKTSIKNFLYQILSPYFNCYKTPRSVNTLGGLIKDINEDLSDDTQIYIAEAGARVKGDIDEITRLLSPSIVVVGEVGSQHIEYFKSVENIRETKLEALNSTKLQMAFLHSTTMKKATPNIMIYDDMVASSYGDLDGVKFNMKVDGQIYNFRAPVLGEFNASNIAVSVLIAQYLGLNTKTIQQQISKLTSVEHRLQKIEAGGKIIIDDSFNGNLKGMLISYELAKKYDGRKVIITPGIVESSKEDNEKLAKKIDEIFDLVMVSGALNTEIFKENISEEKLILIKDKSKMTEILAQKTRKGDLIIFSNDAPNFI